MIQLPPRRSLADRVVKASSRCLLLAAERHYPKKPLDDVATIVSGGTPDTSEPSFWDGDVIWVTPKDLGKPRGIEVRDSERRITAAATAGSSAKVLPIGTVLFSSRAPIGHVGIAAVPLATNQGFKNIICGDSLDPRYLFHMLRASVEEIEAQGRGNTFLEIPAKVLKEYPVPLPPLNIQRSIATFLDALYARVNDHSIELPELPAPVTEQRRIVSRMEALAAKIAEARGLRQQASSEAALLWQAGAREVVSQLATGVRTRIGDVVGIQSGGTPSKANPLYWQGDIPWVSPKDMKSRELCDSIDHISDFAIQDSAAKVVAPGAVLVVTRGMILAHTVPVAILRVPAAINQDIKAFIPQPHLLPEYLCEVLWTLNSDLLGLVERSTHDTRKLETPKLLDFPIPVPSVDDQRRVIADLNGVQAKVNALKQLQAETAAELDALLPAILDRAFRGEL